VWAEAGIPPMQELEKPGKKEDLFPSFEEMVRVFSALANQDALKIFAAARDGIGSSTKTINELELTQKRYYTRLNELIKAGLIEKNEETYQHTMLGKLCYKLGEVFDKALGQRDRLGLLDKLQRSKTLTLEETRSITQALSADGTSGLPDMADLVSPLQVIDNYERLVQELIKYLEKAEESIYFASRYIDSRVVEAVFRAVQRGVKMHGIAGEKEILSDKMQLMRMLLSDLEMAKKFIEFINTPELQFRYIDLPYSFLVIDNKYAMIEVPKPFINSFSVAFIFANETICGRLVETFNSLWKRAKTPLEPFFKIIKNRTK